MSVMIVMRGVGIVHVIAMRTTTLRAPTTFVCIPFRIPVRIPPEIELFHFQEDLQRNNKGQIIPPQTSHRGSTQSKKQTDKLGLVIKGDVIRTPSSRRGDPRCDRDMCVMMVMQVVGINHVIAMRTTPLRVPTTLVRIPVRIPPEIEPFHFQEDLQRNNRGPMRRTRV